MKLLVAFDISNNNFIGTLPWEFGNLNNIWLFQIHKNNLNGTLPDFYGNLWRYLISVIIRLLAVFQFHMQIGLRYMHLILNIIY